MDAAPGPPRRPPHQTRRDLTHEPPRRTAPRTHHTHPVHVEGNQRLFTCTKQNESNGTWKALSPLDRIGSGRTGRRPNQTNTGPIQHRPTDARTVQPAISIIIIIGEGALTAATDSTDWIAGDWVGEFLVKSRRSVSSRASRRRPLRARISDESKHYISQQKQNSLLDGAADADCGWTPLAR